MRINVKGKNGLVPDSTKQYAEKKAKKLERVFRQIDSVVFEQTTERGQHIIELSVEGDGFSLRSEERCADPFAAIDNAVDKMERQARRFKTRVRKNHQRPGPVKEETAVHVSELAEAESNEIDEEPYEPRIVRQKRFPMKPMSPEEAARQLELLDHDFFMFQNEMTGHFNVLYRRRDGDYGIIEPEI